LRGDLSSAISPSVLVLVVVLVIAIGVRRRIDYENDDEDDLGPCTFEPAVQELFAMSIVEG